MDCLKNALKMQFPQAKIEEGQKDYISTFKLVYPTSVVPHWITPGLIYHAGAKTIVMGVNGKTETFENLPDEKQISVRNSLAPIIHQFDEFPERLTAQCQLQVIEKKTGRVCSKGLCQQ